MDCSITATRAELSVDGQRIAYLEWPGAGSPLLILHGITSSAATCWRIGAALAAAGHRTIALDMPGHGGSTVSADHQITTIAAIVGASIVALDLHDLTLIGHSWGGATALSLAAGDHPACRRLSRVIAIDPLLSMNPLRGEAALPNFIRGVAEPAGALAPLLAEQNPDWHPCDVHWKALAYEACRPEQVAGLLLHSGDWNLLDRLAQIQAGLLLLIADPQYSIIGPQELAALPEQMPPHGKMLTIPGTTHNMLRGAGYEATMAAIRSWLA